MTLKLLWRVWTGIVLIFEFQYFRVGQTTAASEAGSPGIVSPPLMALNASLNLDQRLLGILSKV